MKVFTSKTQKVGEIGEKIAERFLVKRGFSIVDRNYTKKCGEIDIVAEKEGILYFCEVKTINFETNTPKFSRETGDFKKENSISINILKEDLKKSYNPEENLTQRKIDSIIRTVQVYFLENYLSKETDMEMKIISIFYDKIHNRAFVKMKDIFNEKD
ncbi:MAG: Holliday junction resolvase-like predicted endonuclease [Flavobacteriaceae bacterium]|jgi:Holliday junction resolvase-like predicted endonuclease